MPESRLGISGLTARAFQNTQITPLLAIVGMLLGLLAILITPKEEEPQIDVTFANIFVPFPGASPREVEQLIVPLETTVIFAGKATTEGMTLGTDDDDESQLFH